MSDFTSNPTPPMTLTASSTTEFLWAIKGNKDVIRVCPVNFHLGTSGALVGVALSRK